MKSALSILKRLRRQKLHPWAKKDTQKKKMKMSATGLQMHFLPRLFVARALLAMALPSWLTLLMPLAGS